VSGFLPREDVARLTKRQRYAAQRRVLQRMGIPFREAADGEPLVLLDALDGKASKARNRGPRWERIEA
jgi:hypothetical protein